ncbi:MAG: hypothetical protein RLZZ175_3081 [Bacteroidota bacterium]
MNKCLIIYIYLTFFFVSCKQSINYDNIKIKDGLYIDSNSGDALDGQYISVSSPSSEITKENVITCEYSNGIPVGDWTETYGGDLIHSGKYLSEENTKSSIQKLTKCKRVDLDNWKEADFPFLNIELIEPVVTDTLTLQKVSEVIKNNLFNKYKFKVVKIDSIGNTNKNFIYEFNIK